MKKHHYLPQTDAVETLIACCERLMDGLNDVQRQELDDALSAFEDVTTYPAWDRSDAENMGAFIDRAQQCEAIVAFVRNKAVADEDWNALRLSVKHTVDDDVRQAERHIRVDVPSQGAVYVPIAACNRHNEEEGEWFGAVQSATREQLGLPDLEIDEVDTDIHYTADGERITPCDDSPASETLRRKGYHILQVIGDIEPVVVNSSTDGDAIYEEAQALRDDTSDDDGVYVIEVDGMDLEVHSISRSEEEEEESEADSEGEAPESAESLP